jgi:hypothetical protein
VETDLRLYLACMPVQREHLEWRRWSCISVGSAASHGVSIASSKLFPSMLT